MGYTSRFSPLALLIAAILLGSAALSLQPPRQAPLIGAGAAGGYWQGTNTASRVPGRLIPTAFVLNQSGANVTGGFVTGTGVYGNGRGSFSGNSGTISWTNSTPQCPGSYTNSYQISGNNIRWTYSGEDCLGPETGSGQATRISFTNVRRRARR